MLLYDSRHMPPILPERTQVAWTYPDVMEAAASGVSEFVRRARLKLDTNQNPKYLNDALKIADMAIDLTAAALGVKPIDHDWFLYPGASPDPNELYDSGAHYLVPDDYSLVVLVENIHPTIAPSPATEAMLALRINQAPRLSKLVLADLNMEHVAYDVREQGYLVDLDADVAGII
jgi:hypothetical protein